MIRAALLDHTILRHADVIGGFTRAIGRLARSASAFASLAPTIDAPGEPNSTPDAGVLPWWV